MVDFHAYHLVARKFGIKNLNDWYHLTKPQLVNHLGQNISATDVVQSLCIVYPNHTWKPWMFHDTLYLDKKFRFFFDWLGLKLGFKTKEDYFGLKKFDVFAHGGQQLLYDL